MPALIDAAVIDTASAGIVATGPVVVTTTGTLTGTAHSVITVDIGGGEAVAYRFFGGEDTSLARLELPAGATFKAYVKSLGVGSVVSVNYVYV